MTALDDAWQGALAAEHAAVWGYATLGPLLAAADVPAARAAVQAHRALRDTTAAALAGAGLVPVGAQADYPLPFALDTPTAARHLALRLEEAAASAWRYLVAEAATATPPAGLRTAAQAGLTASAVRAVGWRRLISPTTPTVPFPGL